MKEQMICSAAINGIDNGNKSLYIERDMNGEQPLEI